jgi:hypothetical protein
MDGAYRTQGINQYVYQNFCYENTNERDRFEGEDEKVLLKLI